MELAKILTPENPNPLTDYDKTLHNWLCPWDKLITQNWYKSAARERLAKYVKYKAPSFYFYYHFSRTRLLKWPFGVFDDNCPNYAESRKHVSLRGRRTTAAHIYGVKFSKNPQKRGTVFQNGHHFCFRCNFVTRDQILVIFGSLVAKKFATELSWRKLPAHYVRSRTIIGMHDKPKFTWLVTSRHDTTRHVRLVEPMHFGCVELVGQHSSARHTWYDEFDSLDTLDKWSSTGSTCSTRRARQTRLAT